MNIKEKLQLEFSCLYDISESYINVCDHDNGYIVSISTCSESYKDKKKSIFVRNTIIKRFSLYLQEYWFMSDKVDFILYSNKEDMEDLDKRIKINTLIDNPCLINNLIQLSCTVENCLKRRRLQ